MPESARGRGRRQQKVALERELRAAGRWEWFKEQRERLVANGVERPDAWDLMAACWREMVSGSNSQ